jgi:hypothetical protein
MVGAVIGLNPAAGEKFRSQREIARMRRDFRLFPPYESASSMAAANVFRPVATP